LVYGQLKLPAKVQQVQATNDLVEGNTNENGHEGQGWKYVYKRIFKNTIGYCFDALT
jgi:hypothetical protein